MNNANGILEKGCMNFQVVGLGCVRMCPNVSECVKMCQDVSGRRHEGLILYLCKGKPFFLNLNFYSFF